MLAISGWIIGTTYSLIFLVGSILGIFILYQSKKLKVRPLSYMGLFIFFAGFTYLGVIIDFLSILITGNNMDNTYGLNGLLSWMWAPLLLFPLVYLGVELTIPKIKRIILITSIVISIVYEILLFLDPLAVLTFEYPETSGENLIDGYIKLGNPVSVLGMIGIVLLIIFNGFGFLYRGIQSKGIVRKKFLVLSIGIFLYITCALVIDVFFAPNFVLFVIFIRFGIVSSLWVLYLGIREEPEKKIKPEKEIKVEGDLFRISKRPDQITEEEVSISKEKKICLVCKGKVEKFNIFICSKCDTFYCENCARTLSGLENACWVCNSPFDESIPSKPFKMEGEIDLEISKTPKNDKSF